MGKPMERCIEDRIDSDRQLEPVLRKMSTQTKGQSKSSEDQPDTHKRDRSGMSRTWRRSGPRSEDSDITLEDLGYREDGGFQQACSSISLGDELLGDIAQTDAFESEVAKTSSVMEIGRQEAKRVVFTNILIQDHGNVDKALLFVVSKKEIESKKTILSVLDCLIEPQGSLDQIRVYYNILESDESGNTPDDKDFDSTQKSTLQIISKQGNKNIVYHDAVRLLVRKKWKNFARSKFQINSFIYMLTLIALSFSVIVAVMTENPAIYDSPLQIARAITEFFCSCMVILTLITELNQLRRQTCSYAQILGRVIVIDFVQFGVVFIVVLLAFSGSFYLSLRGDKDLDVHSETSTFWGTLLVGVRTLSEAQPVVTYTGSEGYSTISTIFMVLFLFTCCVILLNILIAQLSETYQKVQQDAQRGLEVNRAWIVAKVELNSFFNKKDFRKTRYVEYEDIPDLRIVLEKWESPPLNEMNKYVKDIWDSLDTHKMNLLIIQQRMARQENALRKIQEQMTCLVSLHTGEEPAEHVVKQKPRPTIYRSNTKLATSAKSKAYKRRSLPASVPEDSDVTSEDTRVEIASPEETFERDAQESFIRQSNRL